MKTAILVDGAFYRDRANTLFGKKSPAERARELVAYCLKHLESEHEVRELYRIFYYDCRPMSKTVYHPLLHTDISVDQNGIYTWMDSFILELTKKRKFALRLGRLSEQASFTLRPEAVRNLMDKKITVEQLKI